MLSDEQAERLNALVDGLGLSYADRRLAAGHDDPDSGCVLLGVGMMMMHQLTAQDAAFLLGIGLTVHSPDAVRTAVDTAVNASAREVLAGLEFAEPELPDEEANRK